MNQYEIIEETTVSIAKLYGQHLEEKFSRFQDILARPDLMRL